MSSTKEMQNRAKEKRHLNKVFKTLRDIQGFTGVIVRTQGVSMAFKASSEIERIKPENMDSALTLMGYFGTPNLLEKFHNAMAIAAMQLLKEKFNDLTDKFYEIIIAKQSTEDEEGVMLMMESTQAAWEEFQLRNAK